MSNWNLYWHDVNNVNQGHLDAFCIAHDILDSDHAVLSRTMLSITMFWQFNEKTNAATCQKSDPSTLAMNESEQGYGIWFNGISWLRTNSVDCQPEARKRTSLIFALAIHIEAHTLKNTQVEVGIRQFDCSQASCEIHRIIAVYSIILSQLFTPFQTEQSDRHTAWDWHAADSHELENDKPQTTYITSSNLNARTRRSLAAVVAKWNLHFTAKRMHVPRALSADSVI